MNIRFLVPLVFAPLLALPLHASAQSVLLAPHNNSAIVSSNFRPYTPPFNGTESTLSADSAISYFNTSLPTIDWLAGGNYGVVIPIFGERFTLSKSSGYLDSAKILIDSTSADTIFVAVLGVVQTGTGLLVPDISSGAYTTGIILGASLPRPAEVTINFNHTLVPQDFVIAVQPNINYTLNQYKGIWLRGDMEATQTLTIANTHADFVYIYQNAYYSSVLDSVITLAGATEPAYSNLYLTAFASSSASGVSTSEHTQAVSIYPNPASDILQFSGLPSGESVQVEVFDQLGRSVVREELKNDALNISKIPNGNYQALIHSSYGIKTVPFLIER